MPPKNNAFTVKLDFKANALKTAIGVSEAFDPAITKDYPQVNQYVAIWDTGATGSVITDKVAKELGLKPTGVTRTSHAGGQSTVNTYLVNVYLPNNLCVVAVQVTEAVLAGNTEILIGMDIISQGDFAVTHVGGKTCFTFRMPSIKCIDYEEENKKPSWLKPSRGYKGNNR